MPFRAIERRNHNVDTMIALTVNPAEVADFATT
jgi:hypothetical protein